MTVKAPAPVTIENTKHGCAWCSTKFYRSDMSVFHRSSPPLQDTHATDGGRHNLSVLKQTSRAAILRHQVAQQAYLHRGSAVDHIRRRTLKELLIRDWR